MTKRAPKIPPEARKVSVETSRGMFGRDGPIKIHAIAFDKRDPYFPPVEVKSKAAASNLLKRLGFVKVGRPSPYSGAQEWHRLTPAEVAALPAPESPRELRERWRENPSADALRNHLIDKIEAHLRHRHAYKLATVEADYRYDVYEFDRITGAKSAKTSERAWKAARKHANYEGRGLDGSGSRLTAAFAEYVAKVPGIDVEAERARVLATLHNLEGGYLGNPCGGEFNPAPPSWIANYVRSLESAIRDIAPTAEKAYGDPKKYAPQFDNLVSDFFNIESLARVGERRAKSDAKRLAAREYPYALSNPEPLPRLALLGSAVEIRTTRATLKPRGALLLVSEDGRQIVIARPTRRQAIAAPSGAARARGMFAKWAGRKSDRAVRLSVPAAAASFDLGEVKAIRYRSDKWTGRPLLYEHKFDGKATAIADSPRAPRLIRIDGVPARVLVTERGIVG